MRRIIIALLCVASSACTQLQQVTQVNTYLNDTAFKTSEMEIDPDAVFALDTTMQTYLEQQVIPRAKKIGPQRALYDALSSTEHLKLDYDTEKTRNAREAFAAKSGNCLSLVILTAALAKKLDVQVFFQDVQVPQLWARHNNLHITVSHVNIILSHRRPRYDEPTLNLQKKHILDQRYLDEALLIDFLPSENLRNQRAVILDVNTILAMYFNNRAFELLSEKRLDEAYWHIRTALKIAPTHHASLNTLGVIYRQRGDLARAERIFRDLLQINDRNTMVLSNLIDALQNNGKQSEAEHYASQLKRYQKIAPFENFDHGMLAMSNQDYLSARRFFEKEIELNPDYDESHFWLALALLKSGKAELAVYELQLAKQYSTTFSTHAMYSNKLERLKAALAK